MPSTVLNPMISPADAAARELDAASAAGDFGKLFRDMGQSAAEEIWGGSAVIFRSGVIGVVPKVDPVSVADGVVRVAVREQGTFAGRPIRYGEAWFKDKVTAVYLGALSIDGEGDGSQAVHPAGVDGSTRVVLTPRPSFEAGNVDWPCEIVWQGGDIAGSSAGKSRRGAHFGGAAAGGRGDGAHHVLAGCRGLVGHVARRGHGGIGLHHARPLP